MVDKNSLQCVLEGSKFFVVILNFLMKKNAGFLKEVSQVEFVRFRSFLPSSWKSGQTAMTGHGEVSLLC